MPAATDLPCLWLCIPEDRLSMRLAGQPSSGRTKLKLGFLRQPNRPAVREIRDARSGSDALGGKRFQARIATALGGRVTRGKAGRPIATRDAVPEQQSDLF
ncbi:MAG: hypothetical protein WCF44_03480 [Candidatus Methylophosphatis roskildensis]